MKNKWKIALAGASILLLAGCGNQANNQNENQSQSQAQNQEEKSNGVINSIKDAMSLGKTMRCTYKMGEGEHAIEVVSYVKGEKYAMEMNMEGQKQKSIYDEKAMYSWVEGEKKGTKMTKSCLEELDASTPESDDDSQPSRAQMQKEFENAMDVKCEPVASADFSVPSGIEFEDQCEMMKNLMKNIGGQNGAGMLKGMDMPQMQ